MVRYPALLAKSVSVDLDYRLIVALWKFDVLRKNIIPRSEASRASNFQGANNVRPIVPRQKHSIVFNVVH